MSISWYRVSFVFLQLCLIVGCADSVDLVRVRTKFPVPQRSTGVDSTDDSATNITFPQEFTLDGPREIEAGACTHYTVSRSGAALGESTSLYHEVSFLVLVSRGGTFSHARNAGELYEDVDCVLPLLHRFGGSEFQMGESGKKDIYLKYALGERLTLEVHPTFATGMSIPISVLNGRPFARLFVSDLETTRSYYAPSASDVTVSVQVVTLLISNYGNATATSLNTTSIPRTVRERKIDFVGGSYPGAGGTCGSELAPLQMCTVVVQILKTSEMLGNSDEVAFSYFNGVFQEEALFNFFL